MSETAVRNIPAVGTFAETDVAGIDVPSDRAEALAKLEEVLAKYEMGDVITEEDQPIIKAYLPVIGAENVRLSCDNALIGEDDYEFEFSDGGCDFAVKGHLASVGHGEGRTDMWLTMQVDKLAGIPDVLSYKFVLSACSIGCGPTGVLKVLFKRDFERVFEGTDSAAASYYDLCTFTQWGFLYTAKCIVQTTEGVIVIK